VFLGRWICIGYAARGVAGFHGGSMALPSEIDALVASQSIACHLSDPSETVAEIAFEQRAGDWLVFPSQCLSSPIPFQPPSPAGNHTPDSFDLPLLPEPIKARLLDDFVGAGEDRLGDCQTKCVGSLPRMVIRVCGQCRRIRRMRRRW
jgi:hypothetical protein